MMWAVLWQAYQKRADEAGVDLKPPGPLTICKEIYKEEGILVCLPLPELALDSVKCMHSTCLHSSVVVFHCCVSHTLPCVLCTAPCMAGVNLRQPASCIHATLGC